MLSIRLRHTRPTILALLLILPALAAFGADRPLDDPPAPAVAEGDRFPYDLIGGDDIPLTTLEILGTVSLDIADDGTIFAAVHRYDTDTGNEIRVYRSTDQGNYFYLWGTLSDPSLSVHYMMPCLEVVEGLVDAVYLAYQHNADVCMVTSPITAASAAWSAEVVVMSTPGVNFTRPRFTSDVSSHTNYYLYLVAEGQESMGADIWFARSTDHGASFEPPYMLATLSVEDRDYRYPVIAHGFGGHLHVAWYMESDSESYDASIRYRRASNYAGSGIADWDYWVTMTSTTDGYDDTRPAIEAGAGTDEVAIVYRRYRPSPFYYAAPGVFVSHDTGISFDPVHHWHDGPYLVGDLQEQPGTGIWMLMGTGQSDPCLYTAHESDLTDWSTPLSFQDEYLSTTTLQWPSMALDPSHAHRPAALWIHTAMGSPDPNVLFFDADWKNDPGWPNYDPGFPVYAPVAEATPPALVDLDDDGDLEIVYSGFTSVHAYHHDGSPADGWPVDVGTNVSPGPVAVGDLNGDGYPLVVVGTTDGEAYAYDHLGRLMPGWPTTISGAGEYVYVSIGALGGGYHRSVVCVSDYMLRYRNRRGVTPAGSYGWNFGGDYDFIAPAAIGDIDLDGAAEVVLARGTAVFAAEMMSPSYDWVVTTGHEVYDAPTLGDLDLDGDLEILVPSSDGILTVLDHTGAPVGGGFPWDSGLADALSCAALANVRGFGEPEIIFNTTSSQLHVLYNTALPIPDYPVTGSSPLWPRHNSPAVERIEGTSGDMVVVMSHIVDAWDNFGDQINGWAFEGSFPHHGGPAAADIDLDGRVEVVLLSSNWLHVLDMNNPPGPADQSWPMYGHDPQRTGCSDCPEDVTTAIDPEPDGERITRVSFAVPSPNPVSGSARFSYAVPTRAVVSLEIYDLRGARVATVLREEFGPGRKVLSWNGRDNAGAPLASGHYFARLRVKGPDVNEELVRKLTVLR